MESIIKNVIIELSKHNFDLSYIKSITVETGFDLRLSKRIEHVVITHGRYEYYKKGFKEIKIEGIKITQCYIGEMKKGTPRYQKSFLVKRTEAELKNIEMEQDWCDTCLVECTTPRCHLLKNLTKTFNS